MDVPIQVVAQRTGLSQHVLRVWEKRYRAVVPSRTPTGRRLYSPAHIHRLNLLREATGLGHSIGGIAQLDDPSLQKLVETEAGSSQSGTRSALEKDLIQECVQAIQSLDGAELNRVLERAALALGYNGLLRKLIAPLAHRLGDLWGMGELQALHEHFASVAICAFVLNPARYYAGERSAPTIVVATMQGQLHEIGAVLVAALAVEQGWRAIYLGPSLPAAEIAGAVKQAKARAVALSFVYPGDDPAIAGELKQLRRLLDPEVTILAGGRAANKYATALSHVGAFLAPDLAGLQEDLQRLRRIPD